jgi:hypothetical protein
MPINYTAKGMKRPNEPVNWTPELQKEYIKCSKDIYYFAENYYTVVEEKRGKHIIKLFDYQREMIKNFVESRFTCLLSARQMGKCLFFGQTVEILDTESGEIQKIKIGDLFNIIKNNY